MPTASALSAAAYPSPGCSQTACIVDTAADARSHLYFFLISEDLSLRGTKPNPERRIYDNNSDSCLIVFRFNDARYCLARYLVSNSNYQPRSRPLA
jgi:hypothetical protein